MPDVQPSVSGKASPARFQAPHLASESGGSHKASDSSPAAMELLMSQSASEGRIRLGEILAVCSLQANAGARMTLVYLVSPTTLWVQNSLHDGLTGRLLKS